MKLMKKMKRRRKRKKEIRRREVTKEMVRALYLGKVP